MAEIRPTAAYLAGTCVGLAVVGVPPPLVVGEEALEPLELQAAANSVTQSIAAGTTAHSLRRGQLIKNLSLSRRTMPADDSASARGETFRSVR
jgi:hypothetical protein